MKKDDIRIGTKFGYWTVIEPPDVSRHDYVRCRCSIGKRQIHLGFFDKLNDAKAARKAAEQRYFADRQEKANEIKEKLNKDSSK